MSIVGFNYDIINASRGDKIDLANLKIDHSLNIKDVTTESTVLADQKQDLIKFTFEFVIDYQPNYGKITLQGHVLYTDDSKKLKELEKQWKKDKNLPAEITQLILNTILIRSNVKGLMLAQEVGLPPHIPLPIIRPGQGQAQQEDMPTQPPAKGKSDGKKAKTIADNKSKEDQETEDYIG